MSKVGQRRNWALPTASCLALPLKVLRRQPTPRFLEGLGSPGNVCHSAWPCSLPGLSNQNRLLFRFVPVANPLFSQAAQAPSWLPQGSTSLSRKARLQLIAPCIPTCVLITPEGSWESVSHILPILPLLRGSHLLPGLNPSLAPFRRHNSTTYGPMVELGEKLPRWAEGPPRDAGPPCCVSRALTG